MVVMMERGDRNRLGLWIVLIPRRGLVTSNMEGNASYCLHGIRGTARYDGY